ncbi:MAG: hypothetical protein ACKOYI_08435, partial [Actinomycetota bacterium]
MIAHLCTTSVSSGIPLHFIASKGSEDFFACFIGRTRGVSRIFLRDNSKFSEGYIERSTSSVGLSLGREFKGLTQLWRHATRAGPWLALALFLALLFAGSSHALAREPDTREKSPPVLGPPFNAEIARNSLLVVDESDPVAGVSWAGNDVANYVPNAATLRDSTLTASADTVVTASHLAALLGGQETVRI